MLHAWKEKPIKHLPKLLLPLFQSLSPVSIVLSQSCLTLTKFIEKYFNIYNIK